MSDIAVVITCRSLGRYLHEALESVVGQTLAAAEIVVVDDGSEDLYTRQVLARLEAAPPPTVRIVRSAHVGVSAARNRGASTTSSAYLVFLDADDVLAPTYLEKTAGLLDGRPELAFVSTAMRGFGDATYDWTPPRPGLMESLAGGFVHVASTMRRAVWEGGGGFDPELEQHEDVDFWIGALALGLRGEVIDEPLLHYRVREGSNYQLAVDTDRHLRAFERIFRKHPLLLRDRGVDLIVARETFLLGQRAHLGQLESRRADIEGRLATIEGEIRDAKRRLEERGEAAVALGDLDRSTPISPIWGLDRGGPLDRHYIERFLDVHREDIAGHVLEVKDPGYGFAFGAGRVTRQDVVDIDPDNEAATVIADLTHADSLGPARFDCFVMTQTLNVLFDVRAALQQAHRALRPGGVLLVTVSALNRVSYEGAGRDGDYWRFTEASMRELLAEHFSLESFEVWPMGNVRSCAAFLYGLSSADVGLEDLDRVDPWFPLVICARAVKSSTSATPAVEGRVLAGSSRSPSGRGAILMYHRVARLEPDTNRLCVPPDELRDQLRSLASHYRVMTLSELAAAAVEGVIPDRAVAITFDDGYIDQLENASVLLVEAGLPATFFVATELLDSSDEYWWDLLERVFLCGAVLPVKLDLPTIDDLRGMATEADDERVEVHRQLTERFYIMAPELRRRILAELSAWSGLDFVARPTHRVMTSAEVCALAGRAGHEIGVHTAHHLPLPSLARADQVQEITLGRYHLERRLRRSLTTFSYPFGEHDEQTVDVVRQAGFGVAVTTVEGAVEPGADPLRLPRLEIRAGDDLGARLDELLAR